MALARKDSTIKAGLPQLRKSQLAHCDKVEQSIENALAPRPRQRVRHPGGANHGEIHGALAPVPVARVIGQEHPLVHQQAEGREHGGHQDRGEAGLHAGQDRNARRDEANPGRITPELLRRRQPFGDQRGGVVHIDKMCSAKYQRTNPERQLAQARKARGQCRIDPGGGGIDDQPARGDRELHGDVFVGDEYSVIGEQQAAVHQDDDKERVVDSERRGAPGRGSARHTTAAAATTMNAPAA